MNRGARGWEPKVRAKVIPEGSPGAVDVSYLLEPAVEMIEVNGVWMTREDARKHANQKKK